MDGAIRANYFLETLLHYQQEYFYNSTLRAPGAINISIGFRAQFGGSWQLVMSDC